MDIFQKQSSLRKELDRVKAENEALMSHKQVSGCLRALLINSLVT